MSRISIVIPAYNAQKYLAETLDSVIAQTFADWDAIVVNDGSADGTGGIIEEYAKRDPRIRGITKTNAGVADARNSGYESVSPGGEFVIFLDSDDLWEPEALAILFNALQKNPDCVGSYGLARYIDGESSLYRIGELESEHSARKTIEDDRVVPLEPGAPTTFASLNLNEGCRIATPGQVLLRRASFERAGRFDKECTPVEDWEMWLRLTQQGGLAFAEVPVLRYRVHESNLSGNNKRMSAAHVRARRKVLSYPGLTPEQRRAASAGYRYYCRRKVDFALACLAKGQLIQGLKQARRALINYGEYLRAVRSAAE